MRAAIGYERPTVEDLNNHWEAMRKWLSVGPKATIRIMPDDMNNVGRLASILGDIDGRAWRLLTPMRDQMFNRFYLVVNIHTGERRIVWRELLTNLW